MIYAAETSVPVEKTKAALEQLLVRYGAQEFISGWSDNTARIGFVIGKPHSRRILFVLPLPDRNDKAFFRTKRHGLVRSPEGALKQWEQACRSRWRALLLVIKAKLEAASCGISTIEDEFMAWTVVGDGRTIGEIVRPMIARAIQPGRSLQIAERSTEVEP